MKKLILGLIAILILALTVNAAFAQTATLDASELALGSSSQKREQLATTTWTVRNVGNSPVTDLGIQLSGIASKYNVTTTLPSTTIPAGGSIDVPASLFVPDDEDAGTKRIGQVIVTGQSGSGTVTLTRDVTLTVENNLVINKIIAEVDGKRDTLSNPGTIDEDAELDSEIELTIEVENTFDTNIEIDSIDIELESSDLDDADGLDDTISSLDEGDNDEVTFTFSLDSEDIDPSDAPFTITVKVSGDDENGAQHGEEWDIKLDMDVKSRDLSIVSATVSPSILSCEDRTLRFDLELRNIGTRDLDEAMINFNIDQLSISDWMTEIALDEGDRDDFSHVLTLPRDVEPGEYTIELEAYPTRSTSTITDDDVLTFTVDECEDEEEPPIVIPPRNETTNGNGQVPVITGRPVATGTGSNVFGTADTYLILLGALVLVMIVVIIMLFVKLSKAY